jgi:hypothetical protein
LRTWRRLGAVASLSALIIVSAPALSAAAKLPTAPSRVGRLLLGNGATLGITVPATVNLGAAPTGAGTLSAQMGTITVTASGLVAPTFTATVSTTTFTTGTGQPAQTVPAASIFYWSGPVTASTGLQTAVPGQLTALQAQALSSPLTAFSSSGAVLTITTSWDPTIVVHIPAAVVAGTYTGTITHSVA